MSRISFARNLSFFVILLSTGLGCTEEDTPYIITCNNGPIDVEQVPYGNYRLQNVEDRPNYLRNLKLTIQTQADFEYYFELVEGVYPKIDFKRKTLLFVRTDEKLAFRITQRAVMDCDKKLITWQMDALSMDSVPHFPEFSPIDFAILVPKISGSTHFLFQPHIIK